MPNQIISFHYTLTDPSGATLDSSAGGEPLSFVTGMGQIIPGLEVHLADMNIGDKKRVTVPAKDAYGEKDTQRVFDVPAERFPMPVKDVKIGDQFRMGGGQQTAIVTVKQITDKAITLDANHPLAGVDLTFDVEMMGKRDATPEDMQPSGCCGGSRHAEQGGCCDGEHHHDHGGGCGHSH
jgi:FKBP-type peptidyl-prolyl cis-trans isomerase SlyD